MGGITRYVNQSTVSATLSYIGGDTVVTFVRPLTSPSGSSAMVSATDVFLLFALLLW